MEANLEDWKQHIEAWQKSGLSQNKYCQANQLNPSKFSYEKNKLLSAAARDKQSTSTSAGFALAQIQPVIKKSPKTSSNLSVKLPNGAVISGVDESNYELVLKLMEAVR